MLKSGDIQDSPGVLQLLQTIGSHLSGNIIYQLTWYPDGRKLFTYVSPNVETYTGVSAEEIIRTPELLYNTILEPYRMEILRKEEASYTHFTEFETEAECRMPNGEIRWVYIRSMPQQMDDGSVIWNGIQTDITDRKLNEQKLFKNNHELTLLNHVNDVILTATDAQVLLADVCRILVEEGGYKLAWMAFYPDASCPVQAVKPIVSFGETRYLAAIQIDLTDERLNKGPTATTLLNGTTSITNNFSNASWTKPWRTHAAQYGIGSSVVIPLEFQFRKRGALTIYSSNINAFDAHEVKVLERLAKNLTLAVYNLHNQEEKSRTSYLLNERVKELQTLHLANKTLQNETLSVDELLNRFVALLPGGWQYPDHCEARIVLKGKTYETAPAIKAVATQQSTVYTAAGAIGCVEIHYTQPFPEADEGPFLQEERSLIDTIAEMLGVHCNRKNNQEALLKSEANLRSVFDNTQIGFVLMDTQFNVVAVNNLMQSEYAALTGLNLKPNENYLDQVRTETRDTIHQHLEQVLTEQRPYEYETRFFTNGQHFYFNVTLVPVKNGSETIGVCLSAYNITKRKNMEREWEQITADLTQRNRDLEQFAYIVSHNLRGPLSSILGLNTLLKEELNEEERLFSLRGIEESAEALDKVLLDLNSILQIRRDVTQTKEPVNLDTVLKNTKNGISHSILESKTIIEADFSAAPTLHSVPAYLGSILYNLISNSIKYAKEGIPAHINITSNRNQRQFTLYYKDNGIGIDMERYGDQLFGLYKRFNNHVEGKGLGLFMVKTQVEALGGTIRTNSKKDEGVEFIITFEQ